MNEKELKEIEELKNTLVIIGQFEIGQVNWEETAKENYKQGIRKIPEGAVVLSKEEYEDLCNDYDKVYEQAKADILGNMADGGTSCHWCIDNHKEQARKETARDILQVLSQYGDRDEALRRHILCIADEYGVEVEERL